MADSATDSRLGLEVDAPLKCPRCGSTIRKGAKRCPQGHAVAREAAMARRVAEARSLLPTPRHGSGRWEVRLHPRDRSGQWRRTFSVVTPRGKVAGHVEQHTETGEFRAVARTEPKGVVPGMFHTAEQANNAVLTHHYQNAFDEHRFDHADTAHDVSYTLGTGGVARGPGGNAMQTEKVTRPSLSVGDTVLATREYPHTPGYRGFKDAMAPAGTKMEPVKIAAIDGPQVTFEDGTGTTLNGGARILKVIPQSVERVAPSLSDRRAQAAAAAAAIDAKSREVAIPEPTGPTKPGSLAGKDLTMVHPKAIDSELGRLWNEQAKYQGYIDRMDAQDALDRARGTRGSGMPEAMAERHAADREIERARYKGELAKLGQEAAPLQNEFTRRGGWDRYFLVTNGNGHVHNKMNCMTCFPTTQFAWLPDLAAKTETSMVKEWGEKACSVCFPSAPSMYEAMKADGKLSNVATQIQADRDARNALRDAKRAEKDAKAITMPDGSTLRGSYGSINTLVTARRELVGMMMLIGGAERVQAAGNTNGHVLSLPEYRQTLENIIAAISHKTNESPDQIRADALAKAEAKANKQGGWW